MSDQTKIKLPPLPALPLPDGTLYGVDRKVKGHPFLPAKVRAFALQYGELCTLVERAAGDKRVAGLVAGNTSLLEALMNVLAQQPANYVDAMSVLKAAGMVDVAGDLDFAALTARKTRASSSGQAVAS
jgi:hypothetical protein